MEQSEYECSGLMTEEGGTTPTRTIHAVEKTSDRTFFSSLQQEGRSRLMFQPQTRLPPQTPAFLSASLTFTPKGSVMFSVTLSFKL